MKTILYALIIALASAFVCTSIQADIYRYQDENGVWHFTNVQRDKKYTLFMRTYTQESSRFLKDFDPIIEQAAREFSVESSLIKAIIKAESDFDHQAVSKKGAQGLMQLMPNTSTDMAVEDPFNPEENIFGGVRYLSILLKRFNNDKRLAVAAYNAGPENVEAHNGVPPFPETEEFIEKVFRFLKQFEGK
ncbi:MAG: lytic transglycosylase domain-containing protein [Deltaproteobacteria bacterium]|nr:lytic transglycosylase domain-containing protein [Deltaproteobacteria bacterium]